MTRTEPEVMGKHPRGYRKQWVSAVESLIKMKLNGLVIICPRCGEKGMLVSRWEKGPNIKPVLVAHVGRDQALHLCFLQELAQEARKQISFGMREIKCLMQGKRPFVLFSGGLDSLCSLLYIKNITSKDNIPLTALHVDTTAGFPEVTTYVVETCRRISVELQIVRPSRDYFDLAKKWGIPGVRSRWCCKELKIKPLRDFLAKIQEPKIVFDGIRAEESNIRSTYVPLWFHPAFRCFSASPIFFWSNGRVLDYIDRHKLPKSPAIDFGTSAECWCGAYKTKADFEKLLEVHPEIFRKLAEVEAASRTGYTFIYERGRRVTLRELQKQSGSR